MANSNRPLPRDRWAARSIAWPQSAPGPKPPQVVRAEGRPESVTVCQLTDNPSAYADRVIVVHGQYACQAVSTGPNTAITFDLSKIKSEFSGLRLPAGDTYEAEYAGAVAHEVAHAQDAASGMLMHSPEEHLATEINASRAQAYVAQGLNVESMYGFWSPAWSPGAAAAKQEQAISIQRPRRSGGGLRGATVLGKVGTGGDGWHLRS